MLEEVDVLHLIPCDSDVIKHQTIQEPLLHPPEDLRLLHHTVGGQADVLESDAVDVPRASLPLPRVTPRLHTFNQDLEVLQSRPGVIGIQTGNRY